MVKQLPAKISSSCGSSLPGAADRGGREHHRHHDERRVRPEDEATRKLRKILGSGPEGRSRCGAGTTISPGCGCFVREAMAAEVTGQRPTDYGASYLEADDRRRRGSSSATAPSVPSARPGSCSRGGPRVSGEAEGTSGWKLAVGFAMLLLAAFGALMAGRAVGDRLQSQVVARLQSTFGGKVAVQSAELRLAGGPGVRFSGLSIADPAGGEPLLTAPQAGFTVDVDAAIGGSLGGVLPLDHRC